MCQAAFCFVCLDKSFVGPPPLVCCIQYEPCGNTTRHAWRKDLQFYHRLDQLSRALHTFSSINLLDQISQTQSFASVISDTVSNITDRSVSTIDSFQFSRFHEKAVFLSSALPVRNFFATYWSAAFKVLKMYLT